MALPAQTITNTLNGMGYCRLRHTTPTTPVVLGRVLSVGPIDLKPRLYEHTGWSGAGVEQIAYVFETMRSRGDFVVTFDEILDLDSLNWLAGAVSDFDLQQVFPKSASAAKSWRYIMPFCYAALETLTPQYDKPSVFTVKMIPYHGTMGTASWTFDNNYTAA